MNTVSDSVIKYSEYRWQCCTNLISCLVLSEDYCCNLYVAMLDWTEYETSSFFW
jgi:hypothetical protein